MPSQKSQEIATSFFAPLPNFFPKTTTTTWILNRATPRPPHSRRKGFAHRGCSPGSFCLGKKFQTQKTPTAGSVHLKIPKPKNGKGETNRPFCHQFLGFPALSFQGRMKTAFPSPFRAEKESEKNQKVEKLIQETQRMWCWQQKKRILNFSAPRGDLYCWRSVNPPPKEGLFTPTKTAGAWLGFLGTGTENLQHLSYKSRVKGWTPGHRCSTKEKTTEWKLNKLNPGIYPP